MPTRPQTLRFETRDGISLQCLHWRPSNDRAAAGQGPLVMLHGGGANAHWWDPVAERLAQRHELYALDFRGHGDSDYPEERFVGAFNTDLESMIAWLGREDVSLIGHSLGAAVALDHASRFPDTRGLVLVDLARGGTPGGGRRARLALSLRRTYRTREEAIERFRFLPESSHPNESLRRYIAERSVRLESNDRYGYKFDPGWFSLPARPRPDIENIACPTVLIRGGESTLLSKESAVEFIARIPKGRLIEIPEAGHHVLIDQPDRLAIALEEFLDTVETSE